jgi:hypothetical protein
LAVDRYVPIDGRIKDQVGRAGSGNLDSGLSGVSA